MLSFLLPILRVFVRPRVLQTLLILELLFTIFGGAFTWFENAVTYKALLVTINIGYPQLRNVLELAWLNEKTVEISTRYVACFKENSTYAMTLSGGFFTDYAVYRYRFNRLLERTQDILIDPTDTTTLTQWAEAKRALGLKRTIEDQAVANQNVAMLAGTAYQDAVTQAWEVMQTITDKTYKSVSNGVKAKQSVLSIAIGVTLAVLIIVVTLNAVKSVTLVYLDRRQTFSSITLENVKTDLKARRRILAICIVLFNMTAAVIEGLTTYIASRDVLDKSLLVSDVELVLAYEAGYTYIYDAVLTGSASQYVLTNGDAFWNDRYMANVDKLTEAIIASQKLAQTPQDKLIYDTIDEVNIILVDLETLTLENATANGFPSMFGTDYLTNKAIYNAAAADYNLRQHARVQSQLLVQAETIRFILYLSVSLTIAALVVSLMVHYWKGTNVKNYKKIPKSSIEKNPEPGNERSLSSRNM